MQNQDFQSQIQILVIVGTFALVFLSSFFIFLVVKYNKNLLRKNNEMFKAVIDAGEREKLELSRNLHDQVIPLLAISKLQVESFDYQESPESNEFKTELTDILAKSIAEIRGICHNSSPILFKELGLQKSLLNFFKQLSAAENAPEIQFNFSEKIRMAQESELSIYRILLELVNNTLKYAQAQHIIIDAQLSPKNDILINYRDDGRGTSLIKLGHGLLSIKSRVTLLEGEVHYQSEERKGFQTQIKLPAKLLI
jgi:signal transduction histidine kinase